MADELAVQTAKLKLPLVSVVVVCYNHAPFLRTSLDAVAGQTYPHLQIVVVDNASTDNSRDVIDAFEEHLAAARPDIDLVSVFARTNGHEVGAVVEGFPHTEGSYVIFADGDDILLPGCVEAHIKAHLVSRIAIGFTSVDMYQSSGDDVVVGTGTLASRFVMSKRGHANDLCRMSSLDAFDFPSSAIDLQPGDLHYLPPQNANEWVWSPSSGLCFRREIVSLLLDPPPTFRVGIDNYLVRGACALTGGISIDRALAVYRLHGNNIFSKHPALANVYTFDRQERGSLDDDVMAGLIDCFRANIPRLAASLTEPDLFIGAIDHFVGIAPGLKHRPGQPSFTIAFLMENREAITQNFGVKLYRRWLARHLRPRDIVPLVRDRRRSDGASPPSASIRP